MENNTVQKTVKNKAKFITLRSETVGKSKIIMICT